MALSLTRTQRQETSGKQPPIERVLALLPSAKPCANGFTAQCPAHNDKTPSLAIWEDKDGHCGLKCYAGCSRAAICDALGLAETDLYLSSGRRAHKQTAVHGLTLMDLAIEKHIHPELLSEWGVCDNYTWVDSKKKKHPGVIRIVYRLPDGTASTRAHIRTHVTAKHGSFWEGEGALLPYGLWKLSEAQKAGYCWLVEGESDCWTLWSRMLPALGIPGASNEKVLQPGMLDTIARIYIVNEPDQAGQAFPARIVQRLREIGYTGQCFSVSLHTLYQAKDPNDVLKQLWRDGCMSEFAERMQTARDAAQLIDEVAHAEPDAQTARIQLEEAIKRATAEQNAPALYDLVDQIAAFPLHEQVLLKSLVHAARFPAFSLRDFNALLKEAQAKHARQMLAERVHISGKPQILPGRETLDCLDVLHKANVRGTPRIFIRGGKLCQIVKDEFKRASIALINEDALIAFLAEEADFIRYNEETGRVSNQYPTPRLAKQVLQKWRHWKFPPLVGLIDIPILRPDGTILDKPGYDMATGLYYEPAPGLHIPAIPAQPTRLDALRARNYAFDFISQFPYADQADRANAYALFLSSVLSEFFDLYPMALIDAAKLGSGKGFLAQSFSLIVQGNRSANIRLLRNDEEEFNKKLTTKLSSGGRVITLDNIDFPLHSGTLEQYLADAVWSDRLFGTNNTLLQFDKKRVITLATGNNIVIKGDLSRRCFRIRLDSGVSHPWERDILYRHDPLLPDVERHRGEILAALLTIARAWYLAGQPLAKNNDKADFGQWKRVMGGILQFLDIPGFLENERAFYADTAPEENVWEIFLHTWQDITEKALTVGELLALLQENTDFCKTLPESLARQYNGKNGPNARGFGNVLGKSRDTPYGKDNIKLVKAESDKHRKQARWRVTSSPSTTPKKLSQSDCGIDSAHNISLCTSAEQTPEAETDGVSPLRWQVTSSPAVSPETPSHDICGSETAHSPSLWIDAQPPPEAETDGVSPRWQVTSSPAVPPETPSHDICGSETAHSPSLWTDA
jgi:hypothetical protein